MTKDKTATQEALKLAQEVLEKTDKEKYPKLYEAREQTLKATEYNDNQRIRAEQAEEKAKEKYGKKPAEEELPKKPLENETPKNDYSLQDIRALNDVHDEDVETVEKFAQLYEISISEAKKHTDVQAIIKNREELRATAKATTTKGGRHGVSKATGKELLRKFNKSGDVPDSEADLDAMLEAEFKSKKTQ